MQKSFAVLLYFFVSIIFISITACSNGSSSGGTNPGGTNPGGTAPVAPTLSLAPQATKIFHFTWADVSGETSYRLLENPDGVSGYTQIASIAANTTSYDLIASLPKSINASYMLEACDSYGCSDSSPVSVSGTLASDIGYFKASNNGSSDYFGTSVAISADGNTMAVGATLEDSSTSGINTTPNDLLADTGAVYVFTKDSSGTWTQQAYIKASNPGSGDYFGNSVSLSADGNTLAVGAPLEDSSTTGVNSTPDEAAIDAGAAYLFSRSNGTWTQQAYIKASNNSSGNSFGFSVALSGDGNTLAVGSPYESSNSTGIDGATNSLAQSSGAAYVFVFNGTTWSQQAFVKASNTGNQDNFGWSVALSSTGDTLAVGALYEDSGTTGIDSTPDEAALDAGAAYVFYRSSSTWTQQAYVKASNTGADDNFGTVVALSGDGNTLAVGAPGEDSGTTGINSTSDESASGSGAAYLFSRSNSTWTQQAYVKASNTGAGDAFGSAVALSSDGTNLVVGAPLEDSSTSGINSTADESAADAGAVYFYTSNSNIWSQQAYVKAPNTGAGDNYGMSVSLSSDGGTLAVSAPYEDSSTTGVNSTPDDASTDAGAAYLY